MHKQMPSAGHSFSIEMASRINLNRFSVSNDPVGVLLEGDLGKHIQIEVVEGIMLQISGENGVFRLDLNEREANRFLFSSIQK